MSSYVRTTRTVVQLGIFAATVEGAGGGGGGSTGCFDEFQFVRWFLLSRGVCCMVSPYGGGLLVRDRPGPVWGGARKRPKTSFAKDLICRTGRNCGGICSRRNHLAKIGPRRRWARFMWTCWGRDENLSCGQDWGRDSCCQEQRGGCIRGGCSVRDFACIKNVNIRGNRRRAATRFYPSVW